MKLTLNPKEQLALYGYLHLKLGSKADSSDPETVHLQQVYLRLRSAIVSSLASCDNVNDFDVWMKVQQAKLALLDNSSDKQKETPAGPSTPAPSDILTDDEDELASGSYPKPQRTSSPGKHRPKKR